MQHDDQAPQGSKEHERGELYELANANVVDVVNGTIMPDQSVTVSHATIVAVEPSNPRAKRQSKHPILDLRGSYLMPGLIDAHVHVQQGSADMRFQATTSPSYATAVAAGELKRMLDRGFTTVRDTGGSDYGLARAVDDGYFSGPHIRFAGRALSATGGHGDMRGLEEHSCPCVGHSTTRVCDGVTELRRAAREELRRGAHHIKIMATGGVGSPTDRLESAQYSPEEIRAVVEEAADVGRYVAAHGYSSRGVSRALENGVRSIEHGNLIDQSVADLFLERDAFLVPTLAAYYWMAKEGEMEGAPKMSLEKNANVLESGLEALEMAHRKGVKIAYGTDLLGAMRKHQLTEFTIRNDVVPAADIIRSATVIAAQLLQADGHLGVVLAGANADLLAVDSNPLDDINVLTNPDRHLQLIVQDGRVVKNTTEGS